MPEITQKMLTQQLRQLEASGIITREVFPEAPPKTVHEVNPAERERLEPVMRALCDWGLYWCEKVDARIIALEG